MLVAPALSFAAQNAVIAARRAAREDLHARRHERIQGRRHERRERRAGRY